MDEHQFIKYPEIPYLESVGELSGRTLYLFEKLDGSNCQVRKAGWRVIPGRRSGSLTARAWDSPQGNKSWMGDFKKWALSNMSLQNVPDNIILFGEWLHRKHKINDMPTIDYPAASYDKFYLIDVVETTPTGEVSRFVPYREASEIIGNMGVNGVELLPFQIRDTISKQDIETQMCRGIKNQIAIGTPEGIVFKDYSETPPFMRKTVSAPYEERNSQEKDERRRYCTLPRIRKIYIELMDTCGRVNQGALYDALVRDIIKETGTSPNMSHAREKISTFLGKLR